MTEERSRNLQIESVFEYSDLKKQRAGLKLQAEQWSKAYEHTAQMLGDGEGCDFVRLDELPEKSEVVALCKELRSTGTRIAILQKFFKDVGLQIE